MRIAILGGGISALTSAYFILRRNPSLEIVLFEKEKFLGGMASGFEIDSKTWPLEKTYHHLFANDKDLINFSKEIGYPPFIFHSPLTASLYNSRIIPLDRPQDLLSFPLLPMKEKIRAAFILAWLRFFPKLSLYDTLPAERFLRKTMGDKSWYVLWQELFRKKFGKYAGIILTAFIWARISKRTKKLGYPQGGYQSLVNFLENKILSQGAVVKKQVAVLRIIKNNSRFELTTRDKRGLSKDKFDLIISTLPTPVLIKVGEDLFRTDYLSRLRKIRYLDALNLIVVSDDKLLKKTYWLNICRPNFPFMVTVQHTNFISKDHYQKKEILYIGSYLEPTNRLFSLDSKSLFNYYFPFLKKINPTYKALNKQLFLFKIPFAQPIFSQDFVRLKPTMVSPVRNFFIANLDMTYPYDRGVNYAVKLGKEVAVKIREQLLKK